MSTWAVIGSIVVAVITTASALAVAVVQRRAAPYPALADRVGKLEGQVDTMRKRIYRLDTDLDIVVDAVHPYIDWDGIPPPPTISQAALDIVYRRRRSRAAEEDDT